MGFDISFLWYEVRSGWNGAIQDHTEVITPTIEKFDAFTLKRIVTESTAHKVIVRLATIDDVHAADALFTQWKCENLAMRPWFAYTPLHIPTICLSRRSPVTTIGFIAEILVSFMFQPSHSVILNELRKDILGGWEATTAGSDPAVDDAPTLAETTTPMPAPEDADEGTITATDCPSAVTPDEKGLVAAMSQITPETIFKHIRWDKEKGLGSVLDVINLVTGCGKPNATHVFQRLQLGYPEVLTASQNLKFPGTNLKQRGFVALFLFF